MFMNELVGMKGGERLGRLDAAKAVCALLLPFAVARSHHRLLQLRCVSEAHPCCPPCQTLAAVARSHGFLQLEQEEPYGDISLRRGQYL